MVHKPLHENGFVSMSWPNAHLDLLTKENNFFQKYKEFFPIDI